MLQSHQGATAAPHHWLCLLFHTELLDLNLPKKSRNQGFIEILPAPAISLKRPWVTERLQLGHVSPLLLEKAASFFPPQIEEKSSIFST